MLIIQVVESQIELVNKLRDFDFLEISDLASLLEFLTVSSILLVSIFFLFIYSENASLM
jgi:competence protein ComGF